MRKLHFLATLCPTFPHFARFASDDRLSGIRLNSAMMQLSELDGEMAAIKAVNGSVPLWFDVKGRQLRITEVGTSEDHLEIRLNHPIKVETPCWVLFKAGSDDALLLEVKDNGTHLVFESGPKFMVKVGESIHIRHPSLQVFGDTFCDFEIEKIKKVYDAGFRKFFLSYAESQRDVDALRDLVGDVDVVIKIENLKGMQYVEREFHKTSNTWLMAARGDLYVEVPKPHYILDALRTIIRYDPQAYVGSRIMLSIVNNVVPECHDLTDIAWLYDIGYRSMMLCDEICLKEDLLAKAINIMDAVRQTYVANREYEAQTKVSPYVAPPAKSVWQRTVGRLWKPKETSDPTISKSANVF